jgi:fatty acid synthase
VGYCALNFKDIMLASGKLPSEVGGIFHDTPGFEFSGIRVKDGRRVMGLGVRTLATKVILPSGNVPVWKVPDHWSLEEAATVPLVYLTVYLSLIIRARLKPGEKILIHCGSGGVGMAAINLALSLKCEVFTTAGNDEKRNFIRETFPEVKEDHISSSRDTSFERLIRQQTNGHGVDVVLNSLPGNLLLAGLRALAMHGRFIEIGKLDMVQDNPIGMANFLKDISIHGVELTTTLLKNIKETARLYRLFKKGIKAGVVKPLNRTVFGLHQVEDAFRFMSQAKHIGKVLIRVHGESGKRKVHVFARPRFICDSEKVYLITGGLGGFGLELADWLVRRGAKRLVLTSRNGIQNGYQALRMQKMITAGADVRVVRRNVSSFRSTAALIRDCETMAPLGAIFHLAMVMSDALFLNQDENSFRKVCSIKLAGARHLSRVSSAMCGKLDHFVCFSSIVAAEGNEGQTNYAYANAGMDQLCEQRKRCGLPALSIQWGPIGDVGFIQKNAYVDFRRFAFGLQSIRSCLETLDILLDQKQPVVTSFALNSPVHREVAIDPLQRTEADLVNSILKVFGLQAGRSVDLVAPLHELGMDSLMSVELRLILEYGFDIKLSVQELRETTINNIKKMFNGRKLKYK